MNTTRITQCYLSESLRWFKQGFMDRYSLTEYTDTNAPCIFVGVYGAENANLIKKHKGFKVVMFCGSDIAHAPKLKADAKNISGLLSDMHIYEPRIKELLDVKKYLTIPMKSFDVFKPVPLGDKIYFYARTKKDSTESKFRKDIVDKVIAHFGADKVLLGYQGNTMEVMQSEYYANSFINLNFTPEVGFTSCLEMAHMGRKSISNYPARFCDTYGSEKEIILKIEEEAKSIGVVRHDIHDMALDYYKTDDAWLNVDYWKV